MFAVTRVLPEKIAKFLFEFHGDMFQHIGLPQLPPDRSRVNVHGMLEAPQASDSLLIIIAYSDYYAYSDYSAYGDYSCIF
jgi:hypothetical protein